MASNSPGPVENPQLVVDSHQHQQNVVNTVANVVATSIATSIMSQNQMQMQADFNSQSHWPLADVDTR